MRRALIWRDERNGPVGGRRPVNGKRFRLSWLPCAPAPVKDVTMRTKTTSAVVLGGALLAAPATIAAAQADDPPSPTRSTLRAPVAGHVSVAAQMRAAHRANVQRDLTRRAVGLARRAHIKPAAERRRLRGQAPAELRVRIRELRRARTARARAAHGPAASPALEAIAACESGGNPTTDTGNGFYGKYQFTMSTWASVGGTGNPAAASEAEQDRRASILYAQAGASPWPGCGR
jgi:hypothetical protein